jgi:pimeloyl-ACP methyl ester carboxylesterase
MGRWRPPPITSSSQPGIGYPPFRTIFASTARPHADRLGKNDKIFPADGAHPYKRDLPDAEFHLFDTGHFALEDKADEIVPLIRDLRGRLCGRCWPTATAHRGLGGGAEVGEVP